MGSNLRRYTYYIGWMASGVWFDLPTLGMSLSQCLLCQINSPISSHYRSLLVKFSQLYSVRSGHERWQGWGVAKLCYKWIN